MDWGFGAGELILAPDLAAALEPASKAFAAWEITGEGPFATAEGLARVRAALPSFRFQLTFHASFRAVDLAAPDPAARERSVSLVAGQLDLARGLGASAVVVHPGQRIRGLADPRAEERCAASLAALAARARDLGLEVRVENMPRGPVELAQSPEELARLVAPAARAACWDLGHERTLKVPPDLGPVLPWVREVHLHDNAGANDEHKPLTAASAWVAPRLRLLDRPGLLVVAEHRTVAECLASRVAALGLLGVP
ncbi:MAG TPA: TIM barrel protein [Candidatus Thermoplasmatota archaeon]|nr:TIM barrel protein [Candidatus Thermoplasmatota archaeon]